MDFELTEDQKAIAELAGRILRERVTPAVLRECERAAGASGAGAGAAADGADGADGGWFAHAAWRAFADASVIGAPLPERDGGAGFGILEACLILEQIGQTVAPVPYLTTVVLGALPIAEFGSDQQRARLLPDVVAGSQRLTAALAEEGHAVAPDVPATNARRMRGSWLLSGVKHFVPGVAGSARVLVPARTGRDCVGIFLVDPRAPGVVCERAVSTSFEPLWNLHLDGVEVDERDVLGDPERGAAIAGWILERALAGLCAVQAGVSQEALRLTAAHVSEREQFGHKIATFQAVAQRAADAYVDATAIQLTARQAAYRLSAGLPAGEALAIAKFWAADGGQRVAHAAQHLHGGIGVDVEYPLHRYFRWAKHLELALGGATPHLVRLGASLAERDPD